ncbi:hypothetical protein ACVILK_005633 [Bradyrhizobium embrapense]
MENKRDVTTNTGTNRMRRLARAILQTVAAVGTNVVASAALPTHSRR